MVRLARTEYAGATYQVMRRRNHECSGQAVVMVQTNQRAIEIDPNQPAVENGDT